MEVVGSVDLSFGGVQWIMAHASAESAKLVGGGGVPDILVLGVTAELVVLKGVPCVMIEDQGMVLFFKGLFTPCIDRHL